MESRCALLGVVLLASCIDPGPLRPRPVPLRLVAVETPTRDLDALGRVPSLALRFSRAVAWPDDGAVMLLTGEVTDALRTSAADGVLPPTSAMRAVPARIARDARDPAVITVDATTALLPETALAVLVTPRMRADDGAPLEAPDAGPRALAWALRVAPARRCGALASVQDVAPGEAPLATGRVYVRFDRPVRAPAGAAPFALRTDRGAPVAARSSLDCVDPDGLARCAWIEPLRRLDPLTVYRVGLGPVAARDGLATEGASLAFATGDRASAPRVAFGASPVCATGEAALRSFCVRATDRWIELRATTTSPALVRVTAASGARVHTAVGAPGTQHTVRVPVSLAGAAWSVTALALGADGNVQETRPIGAIETAPALPRVRISEVVARPRSSSAQEYVELVNEATTPASLDGLAIALAGGRSEFPMGVTVPAGGRALVVGPTFDPRGVPRAGDPPVASGTTMVVLRASIGSRGLRDGGGDVSLVDSEGRVLSRVPGADPARAPRAGVGLVRAETDLDDDDPAAWAYDANDGCTPGAPDRLR